MENITTENCIELMAEIKVEGDIDSQAQAWRIIREFCKQHGMQKVENKHLSGMEEVVYFLEFKLNR